ncbi:MAG: hypothetical protein WBE58_17155 [Verrucomicrobiales bacterium]
MAVGMGPLAHWHGQRPAVRLGGPTVLGFRSRRIPLLWLLVAPWLCLGALALGPKEDQPALLGISLVGWTGFLFYQYLVSGLYGSRSRLSGPHVLMSCLPPIGVAVVTLGSPSLGWREWCLGAGLTEMLALCGAMVLLPPGDWFRIAPGPFLLSRIVPSLFATGVWWSFGRAWWRDAGMRMSPPDLLWMAGAATLALGLRWQAWVRQPNAGDLQSRLDASQWIWAIQLCLWILTGVVSHCLGKLATG